MLNAFLVTYRFYIADDFIHHVLVIILKGEIITDRNPPPILMALRDGQIFSVRRRFSALS